MSYETARDRLLERDFEELNFDSKIYSGKMFKKFVPIKNSIEYFFFPFIGDEYAGLRLDLELNAEVFEDPSYTEQDAIELAMRTFALDMLDLASNVARKMTNGDIFHPVIPAEAYDE